MGLSRLSQLLSNTTGTSLYVIPDSIDATDSIENRGNSLTRPFYSLNRAIAEAVRFSYQIGPNNDRFARCTIFLSPGTHRVTNRPGWIPDGSNNFRLRNGTTSSNFSQWDSNTIFDVTNPNNALYKLNSIHGGIFLPRGVSIIGQDYRKTVIIPDYVPNPENDSIELADIFQLTGQNYLTGFTIDDPNCPVYKDYTDTTFTLDFSSHKLRDSGVADGVNPVSIADSFQTYSTTRTDLQMFYEKVGIAFGPSSGREIQPDYPSTTLDLQPRIDEYRIVGSRGKEVAISAIKAGNGIVATTTITVTLAQAISEIDVDTPIRIEGIPASGYDGQYIVKQIISPTQLVYEVSTAPTNALPNLAFASATLNISVDTISSSSPYLLNIASKSVWGRSGLHVDGSKVSGFKSVVVAQYTGISLQKDPRAFVKYNTSSGVFEDNTASGNENIQTDSRARFKPAYENYHIKTSNDGYIQVVSVFAIGYANQFLSESGSDQSINSSTSNFGAKSLVSRGYRGSSFIRDDVGYITHIIPPREIGTSENTISYDSIDVLTTTSVGISSHLYFYNRTSQSSPPDSVIDGYRIGAKLNDNLKVVINSTEYSARIIIPNGTSSAEKTFTVSRSNSGINSITSNVLTLTDNHTFSTGESVRIISDSGQLPDNISSNQLYYVIPTANANQIKLAQTSNDAVFGTELNINSRGGTLSVTSRVSDKVSGEIGHPIQYDSNGWYITVETNSGLYGALSGLSQRNTPRTYISRKVDSRGLSDTIYRLRYVIPSATLAARPPLEGYVIQESNSTIGNTDSEISALFSPTTTTILNSAQLRNQRLISNATWSGGVANINSELPHNLTVGSVVEIKNIKSSNNVNGTEKLGYNGVFTVSYVYDRKNFGINLTTNPGSFTSNTSNRNISAPYFSRIKYKNTFYIYRIEENKKHIPGVQDGVYYLTVLNSSNSPISAPFTSLKFSQPIQNLYPQKNRDNPVADTKESTSFALSEPLGQVVVNEPQYSITKETLQKTFIDQSVGFGITDIISNSAGTAHTIFTSLDHGLNPITGLTITTAGSGYGIGSGTTEYYYNARLVNSTSSGDNATARITVSSSGNISSIGIMDGGSNYAIGDRLSVVGIATTTGFSVGFVSVASIYNHIGESLKINGATDSYNTTYRITGISSSKTISVSSASSIVSPSVSGIGSTTLVKSYVELTGKNFGISTVSYVSSTGIATFTTIENHGLVANNKVLFGGFNSSFFNNTFVVNSVVGLTTFTVSTGVSSEIVSYTGTPRVYKQGASSNGGSISKIDENLNGRMVPIYAGVTTTLNSAINSTTTTITINNAGFKIGDYLLIDTEIVRISATVSGNSVTVFRGVLGTRSSAHSSGVYVYKIRPIPIELRRNSLVRASGHTFEYTGYGSGNYSAGLPDRQDRVLSPKEELLSQATKEDGGVVVFEGMNADGNFYIGSKKINSTTGTEELFDSPIPSVTGEDLGTNNSSNGFNIQSTLESTVSRSIRVEGGINKDLVSQFDGPVIFNEKLLSNSAKGIEAISLYLKGTSNTSRKYTVGDSVPTIIGTPGDVQYNSLPISGGFAGWIFTSNGQWETFGKIGASANANTLGVSNNSTFVGIASLIDFKTTGITLASSYDTLTGITTLTFSGASALGNAIGISTGSTNTFVGLSTQINFNGSSNIVISGVSSGTGIGTINVGLSSNASITATSFIKKGATTTNFLKAGGADAALSSGEVVAALGYTPANSASISGGTASGNSIVLDALAAFNGTTTDFNLYLNGVAFTPLGGPANLIISIGGIIQRPGTDFDIIQSAGVNTSAIRFTTAPTSGLSSFIVALGALGSADVTTQIANLSGQIAYLNRLIVASSAVGDVKFTTLASNPPGWIEANGAFLSRVQYSELFSVFGTRYGAGDGSTTFRIPDYRGLFLRGLDNGAGIDTGRTQGSYQADQNKAGITTGQSLSVTYNQNIVTSSVTGINVSDLGGSGLSKTISGNINLSGGSEVTVKNIAERAIIKAFSSIDLNAPPPGAIQALWHFDGPNNYSGNFIDSGNNGLTIPNPGLLISTTQSVFGGSSLYFDANPGSNVSFPGGINDFWGPQPGANDFTIKLRMRPTVIRPSGGSYPDYNNIIASGDGQWRVLFKSDSTLGLYGATTIIGSATFTVDKWYAICLVKRGISIRLFVDGINIATGNLSSNSLYFSFLGGTSFTGYMDEVQILNYAAHDTNYLPEIAPFPNS
jgi:hypothetical protein